MKTRIDHIDEVAQFMKEVTDRNRNQLINGSDVNNGKVLLVGDFNVDAHNYEKKKKVKILLIISIIFLILLL